MRIKIERMLWITDPPDKNVLKYAHEELQNDAGAASAYTIRGGALSGLARACNLFTQHLQDNQDVHTGDALLKCVRAAVDGIKVKGANGAAARKLAMEYFARSCLRDATKAKSSEELRLRLSSVYAMLTHLGYPLAYYAAVGAVYERTLPDEVATALGPENIPGPLTIRTESASDQTAEQVSGGPTSAAPEPDLEEGPAGGSTFGSLVDAMVAGDLFELTRFEHGLEPEICVFLGTDSTHVYFHTQTLVDPKLRQASKPPARKGSWFSGSQYLHVRTMVVPRSELVYARRINTAVGTAANAPFYERCAEDMKAAVRALEDVERMQSELEKLYKDRDAVLSRIEKVETAVKEAMTHRAGSNA